MWVWILGGLAALGLIYQPRAVMPLVMAALVGVLVFVWRVGETPKTLAPFIWAFISAVMTGWIMRWILRNRTTKEEITTFHNTESSIVRTINQSPLLRFITVILLFIIGISVIIINPFLVAAIKIREFLNKRKLKGEMQRLKYEEDIRSGNNIPFYVFLPFTFFISFIFSIPMYLITFKKFGITGGLDFHVMAWVVTTIVILLDRRRIRRQR